MVSRLGLACSAEQSLILLKHDTTRVCDTTLLPVYMRGCGV